MEPEIAPLDPGDEAAVEQVQQLRVAADAVDVPDFPPPCPHAFRAKLTHRVSHRRTDRFVARRAGEVVGYLSVDLPLRENRDNAEVTINVHPAHRRQGTGRALHAYLLERLREAGRKRYAGGSVESLPGGPARHGAGSGFAAAMGGKAALEEVRRRLDLTTVDEAALAALAAQAEAKATGYRLVSWVGATPEEYAADAGYLTARLTSDAPMGELVWEVPQIDVDRLRESEAAVAAGGWQVYSVGAVHEQSGRLVALTALSGQRSTPWHSFQWITLVEPAHRGHRLGAWVKLANLRQARERRPELRTIDTWNAAVNRHMIAINEAMGFRPVDRWLNWQREV